MELILVFVFILGLGLILGGASIAIALITAIAPIIIPLIELGLECLAVYFISLFICNIFNI